MNFQPTSGSARPRIAIPSGNYVPSVPAMREGANAHMRHPSVVNGKPVAHKAPVGIGSKVHQFAHLR